jgi:hypothetical protein
MDAVARLDLEVAVSHLAGLRIAPAAGGAARTLAEFLHVQELRRVPEMHAGPDGAARVQAAIDAVSSAGGGMLFLDGRILDVERTIHLRAGVAIEGGWGGFRALPGFEGSEVVRTANPIIEYGSAGYAKATSLANLVIDCARQPLLRGLYQKNVQKDRVTGLRIRNCLADGWVVEDGYELFGANFELIAASQRDGGVSPASGARGLVCAATDCHFADGVAQHFAIAVYSPGAHNHFARVHGWSTYHTADPPMLIGFLDEGEGNTFTACNADSPRLLDRSKPAGKDNGGIGFYGDTHSINRRIIGCTVQLSQDGDAAALPPPSAIIPVHCGQVRNTIMGLEVRDYGRAGFAPYVTAPTAQILRETTIVGGNIHEGMAANLYLPRLDAAPFTPRLVIGSDSAGAVLAASHGFAKRLGGVTFFELHLRLARKGEAKGAVSILGLPDIALTWDPDRRAGFVPVLGSWGNQDSVVAILADGTSTLHLVKQFTGAPVTERDLTDTARITLVGHYLTHVLGAG